MGLTRKEFLGLTLKSVFVIGAGNSLQSFVPRNFKLPPKDQIKLRFALASDGHYGQPDTNFAFHHDNMVGWLNKEKESRGVDFSVINGDLFHNDSSFLPEIKKKWDELKMPYYVSHGNHDNVANEIWEKTWANPLYHSFEKNDSGFIILNTANEKGDYICPDIEWTKKHLELYQSKKHLFVFMHITPFKWTKGGIDCPAIVELFDKQSNLRGIFHGHDHDIDGMKENKGKYYFFDAHIAGNWGTEYRGYRIVEVLENGEILSYQMDGAKDEKINSTKLQQ
ncbi:MAG: metallophosphoesterase [Bacteroidetes bacterium]|nr:metallophosphoesterase [Bacteroidota bacterium]